MPDKPPNLYNKPLREKKKAPLFGLKSFFFFGPLSGGARPDRDGLISEKFRRVESRRRRRLTLNFPPTHLSSPPPPPSKLRRW